MFSLSVWIRLKWDPEWPVFAQISQWQCQTQTQTLDTRVRMWGGPWSSGQGISWCFVLWQEKTSHPWQRAWHDCPPGHSHNNRYNELKAGHYCNNAPCGQLSPLSMIVVCGPSLQLETNVHHHHSLRLRPSLRMITSNAMVNISSNENKWVNDIKVPAYIRPQLETLLLSPRFVFYETCPVLIISGYRGSRHEVI